MTIQMKATELYFPVILFIMLYKVVLTFESVVLFIMLYKVVLRFQSVDEILKRDHSNESY